MPGRAGMRVAAGADRVVGGASGRSAARAEEGWGTGVRWRPLAPALAAMLFGSTCPAFAGHVLFDLADRHVLEAVDADTTIPPGRVADLLLVAVLWERIVAGEVALGDRVALLPVPGDRGPRLAPHEPVEVGELLQVLLLTDSRTAAKTLAWVAGPTIGRCLTRMQHAATRLGLSRTTVADDWPFVASPTVAASAGHRGSTTLRDLARLALVVTSDPELRRRLALDGVPISNGGVIVRATDPLVTVQSERPAAHGPAGDALIDLAEHDGLELLGVAAGPHGNDELATTIEHGLLRYRRVELVHEGQPVGPTVRVRGGIIPIFNAIAAEPWALTTSQVTHSDLAFRLQLPSEIDAPVEVHQPLGELVIEEKGRVLGVVPLVAPQAIAPSGWLDTAHRSKLP